MKKIKKLIIPAAGWGTRFLPLTKLLHKELTPVLNRPLIDWLVDEALDSGIEEIYIIVSERKKNLLKYFEINKELEVELKDKNKDSLLKEIQKTNRIKFIKTVFQDKQHGLGHALACAKDVIKNEPFAVILGDDLIKSEIPVTKQMIKAYEENNGANILGVQDVEDCNIHKYGIVKPINNIEKDKVCFEISSAVEKPKLEEAPSKKAILGRYIFNPEILDILSKIPYDGKNEIQVVDAFNELQNKYNQKILAYTFEGTRYDLGSVEGFVKANIDYALENKEIGYKIKQFIDLKNNK